MIKRKGVLQLRLYLWGLSSFHGRSITQRIVKGSCNFAQDVTTANHLLVERKVFCNINLDKYFILILEDGQGQGNN
jgi:hypothetical protein